MSNNGNIFTAFVREIGYALEPLSIASSSTELLIAYLADLGWDFTTVPTSISSLGTNIREISDATFESDDLTALMPKVKKLFEDIRALENAIDLSSQAKAELPEQLAQHIIADYWLNNKPNIAGVLIALGIMRVTEIPAQTGRLPYVRKTIAFSETATMLGDPLNFFKQAFDWGSNSFRGAELLGGISMLLQGQGIRTGFSTPSGVTLNHLFANSINPTTEFLDSLIITLYRNQLSNQQEGFGLEVLVTPETSSDKPGFAISPFFHGNVVQEFKITPMRRLRIESSLSASGGIWLLMRPGKNIEIKKLDTATSANVSGLIKASFVSLQADPTILLGSAEGTHLEAGNISTDVGIRINNQNAELFAELHLEEGKLVIKSTDGDSLVAKILPPGGITVPFELLIGFSDTKGMYIEGGAGFEYTFQVNKQLGPFFVNTVDLGLFADTEGINLTTAVTGGAELGPLTAVVQKIGLKTNVIFGKPGLLGKADLDFGFKLPSAIGLSIKTSGLSGGGFIEIDPPNYAGMINISYENKFDITAYVLISTRYENKDLLSLFIQVMATFSPVQLGMGFALVGVGGCFAYNRGLNLEELKSAMKAHRLDDLMFTESPIKDAAKIFDTIRSVYPIKEGHHTFGFFGKFIWGGSVTIVEFNIGVIIPLGGEDFVIVLLGTAKSRLPKPENALLKLNLEVLGILNTGDETISIDMSLVDSKLQQIDLNGQMALRASYQKGSKNFAMAAGGWYPRFRHIPAGFPSLRRMSGSLQKGNFELSLNSYFAVTSNTLQTGANISISGTVSSFDIRGSAGYDVIIVFSPFSFECNIYFRLRVEKGPISAGVDLDLNFKGPNPYKIDGCAKFKVSLKTFKVSISKTWGDEKPDPLPTISPKEKLIAELSDPRSLRFELPRGVAANLLFAQSAEEKADPVADIIITQSAVPLEYTMDRFGGGKPPSSEKKLSLEVGTSENYKESFAVEQFNDWTKDEKLAAPPYEELNGGKACTGSYVSSANSAEWPTRQIEYETLVRESIDYVPQTGTRKDYRLVRTRTIFHGSNVKYLRTWSKFGSGVYHRPTADVITNRNPLVKLNNETFTVGLQGNVMDGKSTRHEINGVRVGDMTYTQAKRYASSFEDDLVIINVTEAK